MERWSLTAWQAALPVYEEILRHPFVEALAAGRLPYDKFIHYLRQDALYLDSYARVMAHTASRLADPRHRAAYERFSREGIAVEEALHESYLHGDIPAWEQTGKACAAYIDLQRRQADQPVELEVVGTLPCFWIYQQVGEEILRRSAAYPPHRYSQWIATYADPSFRADTQTAIAISDELALAANDALRERMTRLFVEGAKAELGMWDEAWNIRP